MTNRYRSTTAERVAAAQAIANKQNGVTAIQESKGGRPSVEDWIANGGKVEVLPSYGNMFPFDPFVEVGNVR